MMCFLIWLLLELLELEYTKYNINLKSIIYLKKQSNILLFEIISWKRPVNAAGSKGILKWLQKRNEKTFVMLSMKEMKEFWNSKEWKISKTSTSFKNICRGFGLCVKKGKEKKVYTKAMWFSILTIN